MRGLSFAVAVIAAVNAEDTNEASDNTFFFMPSPGPVMESPYYAPQPHYMSQPYGSFVVGEPSFGGYYGHAGPYMSPRFEEHHGYYGMPEYGAFEPSPFYG